MLNALNEFGYWLVAILYDVINSTKTSEDGTIIYTAVASSAVEAKGKIVNFHWNDDDGGKLASRTLWIDWRIFVFKWIFKFFALHANILIYNNHHGSVRSSVCHHCDVGSAAHSIVAVSICLPFSLTILFHRPSPSYSYDLYADFCVLHSYKVPGLCPATIFKGKKIRHFTIIVSKLLIDFQCSNRIIFD